MEIPYTRLSEEALIGVIEEFITREGTEYGFREYSMEEKIRQIKQQLLSGKVKLFFNEESGSCNLEVVE